MGVISITTNKETATALEQYVKKEHRLGTTRTYQLKRVIYEKNYAVVYFEPSHENKEIDPSDMFFLGFYTCLNT